MNITNSDLCAVHKSYYDMCVVYEFIYQLLNYPFFRNVSIEHSSKEYPKQLITAMEDIGIYSYNLRLFNTFQVVRQLQPMTKSFSFPSNDAADKQARALFEMLDYAIPRISFINNCNSIDDVDKLKPMNRLRFEKMVKSRLKLSTIQLVECNFIKYTRFNEKYGFINDRNVDNIHKQIVKIFNKLNINFQNNQQLIDTGREFDKISKELNKYYYKQSLKYARRKQIKKVIIKYWPVVFIFLVIAALITISNTLF